LIVLQPWFILLPSVDINKLLLGLVRFSDVIDDGLDYLGNCKDKVDLLGFVFLFFGLVHTSQNLK